MKTTEKKEKDKEVDGFRRHMRIEFFLQISNNSKILS